MLSLQATLVLLSATCCALAFPFGTGPSFASTPGGPVKTSPFTNAGGRGGSTTTPAQGGSQPLAFSSSCNISTSVLSLPSGQTALVDPGTTPDFLGLGVGVQNYTCASTGTYSSTGAVAQLFDISCLDNSTLSTINTDAYNAWVAQPSTTTADDVFSAVSALTIPGLNDKTILGQHFFVTNPTGASGLNPEFNFVASTGNTEGYVILAKTGDIASPESTSDVDWLELTALSGEGELASTVFRVNTVGGVQPANCTVGTPDISVKYTARYVLYGSSL